MRRRTKCSAAATLARKVFPASSRCVAKALFMLSDASISMAMRRPGYDSSSCTSAVCGSARAAANRGETGQEDRERGVPDGRRTGPRGEAAGRQRRQDDVRHAGRGRPRLPPEQRRERGDGEPAGGGHRGAAFEEGQALAAEEPELGQHLAVARERRAQGLHRLAAHSLQAPRRRRQRRTGSNSSTCRDRATSIPASRPAARSAARASSAGP